MVDTGPLKSAMSMMRMNKPVTVEPHLRQKATSPRGSHLIADWTPILCRSIPQHILSHLHIILPTVEAQTLFFVALGDADNEVVQVPLAACQVR